MARKLSDDPDELAPYFEALAHPFRVAILNELRKEPTMPIAELRRRVAANYEEIDTRNIQFHLFRMQLAGVIETTREEGQAVARLRMDVRLVVRAIAT